MIKYSNKYAKEIMKKYNLRWKWDSYINCGDIQCFCGEWFSNPTRGRVRQISNGTEVNGICVEKIPFEDWFGPTVWNEKEYNNLRKEYEWEESFDALWEKEKAYKNGEKVVSRGWNNTPNPETIECPICGYVYNIGYYRTCMPFVMRIREYIHNNLYYFFIRIKVEFLNFVFRVKHEKNQIYKGKKSKRK